MRPVIAFSALLLVAGFSITFLGNQGRPMTKARVLPALAAESGKYQPYSGDYKVNELPWIFDRGKRISGTVVGIRKAASEPTKSACDREWRREDAYRSLCTGLEDWNVLAVDVDSTNPPLVVYVPVSRLAHVSEGQKILFAAGRMTGDGKLHSLPRFVEAFRNEESGDRPSDTSKN